MITRQYNLLFLNFSFVNNIIIASDIKNLLKQFPFYGKIIKSRTKKFTNAKLLSELPFFEKPKKAKIKQLTTEKLLQEQPIYKKPIKDKEDECFKWCHVRLINLRISHPERINKEDKKIAAN